MTALREKMEDLGLELIEREDARLDPALVTLSTVEPRAVEWLWPGYIPLGKMTILDGDPGLGKSTMMLDFAARMSIGGQTPTGTPLPLASVLYVTSEDDPADTLRPRLDRAGGDPSRIHFLPAIDLPSELPRLERIITGLDVRLVIFDPLVSVLDESVKTHVNSSVRRALEPIGRLAAEHGCSIVSLRHLTKPQGGKASDAIYRGQDSMAFGGVVRSVLAVGRDPEDEDRSVLASVKLNVGRRPKSLAFRLTAPSDYDPARVEWEGESHLSAEDLIGRDREQTSEVSRVTVLASMLVDILTANGGTMLARDGYRALEAEGIDADAEKMLLARARRKAGIVTEQTGFHAGWQWRLP